MIYCDYWLIKICILAKKQFNYVWSCVLQSILVHLFFTIKNALWKTAGNLAIHVNNTKPWIRCFLHQEFFFRLFNPLSSSKTSWTFMNHHFKSCVVSRSHSFDDCVCVCVCFLTVWRKISLRVEQKEFTNKM